MTGNHLFYGDNLGVIRESIADASIDLIYLDPPFNSKRDYNLLFKTPKGQQSEASITAFKGLVAMGHPGRGGVSRGLAPAERRRRRDPPGPPRLPRRERPDGVSDDDGQPPPPDAPGPQADGIALSPLRPDGVALPQDRARRGVRQGEHGQRDRLEAERRPQRREAGFPPFRPDSRHDLLLREGPRPSVPRQLHAAPRLHTQELVSVLRPRRPPLQPGRPHRARRRGEGEPSIRLEGRDPILEVHPGEHGTPRSRGTDRLLEVGDALPEALPRREQGGADPGLLGRHQHAPGDHRRRRAARLSDAEAAGAARTDHPGEHGRGGCRARPVLRVRDGRARGAEAQPAMGRGRHHAPGDHADREAAQGRLRRPMQVRGPRDAQGPRRRARPRRAGTSISSSGGPSRSSTRNRIRGRRRGPTAGSTA